MAERIYPAWRGEFGLVSALDALRHRVAERGALDVKVAVHGEPFDVPLPVVRALLRVAEEAVENVEHHVGAGTVSVDLTFANPAVRLEIADPAGGFDVSVLKRSDGGLGLFRARELLAQEGGQVQIDSAPGRGTRVRAVVDALHGAAT
jgi:signal transduction histidine kinase